MRAALLLLVACTGGPSKLDPLAPQPEAVAQVSSPPKLGDLAWDARATRGVVATRPYAEVRLLADAQTLYVWLSAHDVDLEPTDAIAIDLGELHLRVFADGHSEPALPVELRLDGTLGKPGDDDEGWTALLAVPRARLDDDLALRCGQFATTLALPRR